MSLDSFRKTHKLLIINSVADLRQKVEELKDTGKTIGFTPTMGALHFGHASLMEKSLQENDVSIVSIFVNPRQFNNADDLDKYPRTIENDLQLLEQLNIDIVFTPSVDDLYDADFIAPKVDLGRLESLMEGKMRPGHFDGVVQVLTRLFQLTQPDKAYFGLKDFQQVAVVKKMVDLLKIPVQIIDCPTFREPSGLAFSSRNQRLSEEERETALFIYQSLLKAKELTSSRTPIEITEFMQELYQNSALELEYFEIVHPLTLETLQDEWTENAVACVVAYVGSVRLIDNMRLN